MANPKAALELAAQGYRVIPIHTLVEGFCTCQMPDCIDSKAKHPVHFNGSHAGTTNPSTIASWWAGFRDWNVAVCTGKGIIVLDIDPRHGGVESLATLEKKFDPLPRTREVITGSQGLHFYFGLPNNVEVKNSASRLGSGIDIRGEGGYVVAPPSMHKSGNRYHWRDGHGLDFPQATAPQWLLEQLELSKPGAKVAPVPGPRSAALSSHRSDMVSRGIKLGQGRPYAISGQRGHDTFIGTLDYVRIALDLSHSELMEVAQGLNSPPYCSPPWNEWELKHKVDHAMSYTEGKERGDFLDEDPVASLQFRPPTGRWAK
jgi:Bifunctional DNA primase/polymerase, N-terminal